MRSQAHLWPSLLMPSLRFSGENLAKIGVMLSNILPIPAKSYLCQISVAYTIYLCFTLGVLFGNFFRNYELWGMFGCTPHGKPSIYWTSRMQKRGVWWRSTKIPQVFIK